MNGWKMNNPAFRQANYLDAFMKTAQYLASLTTYQDVWAHAAEVVVEFYGASLAGFAELGPDDRLVFHHLILPTEASSDVLQGREVLETVKEVLESGFLARRAIPVFGPYTVVFLPVRFGNETVAMLVGHSAGDAVSNELLNIYLAVAGLVGSTASKLVSEIELKRHRSRLEELVAERTIDLTRTMQRLEVEISERKQAEEALARTRDELEVRVRERTAELVKANEELREQTRIAQTLMDAMPCVALLLRPGKVVVGTNKKANDLGILPGMVCHQAWSASDRPCPWCNASETLPSGSSQREEIEVGDTCWETYWVAIEHDLFLHYAFDVSDRKKSEKELKAYAQRLEFLNRELQDFAFVASHDLREPLRKIQTFADLLVLRCKESLTDQGRDYLERMTKSAIRMSALLDALLGYSRVASRPDPIVPTDLSEVVREAMSDLELLIDRAEACVEVAPLPVLEADPNQMRQLFQNLISNAIKYRKKEERPCITVRGEAMDGAYNLYVEDNGIGFGEEHLDCIFRPFQRLHGRNEYEGTGMGLAICRKIAERHGGAITAKSSPGCGSIFIVTLPAKKYRSDRDGVGSR